MFEDLPDELWLMIFMHVYTGFQILHPRFRPITNDWFSAYHSIEDLDVHMRVSKRWRVLANDVFLRNNEYKLIGLEDVENMRKGFENMRKGSKGQHIGVITLNMLVDRLFQLGNHEELSDLLAASPIRLPDSGTLPLEGLILRKIVYEQYPDEQLETAAATKTIQELAGVLGAYG